MRDRHSPFPCVRAAGSLLLPVLALALLVGADAHAGTGLTIQPVKVLHTIMPGESVSDLISLTNASDDDIRVEVTVEDFIPAAGSVNIKFVDRAEGITTVRDWVSIGGKDSFVFKKGESRKIPYTIKAPPTAEPGGHFGVAFFKATRLEEAGQLKIGTRVGMLLFVTVPGNNLQKGNIVDFSGPRFVSSAPVDFTVKFENTGTVHFEPKGAITIASTFGNTVGRIPVEGQVVLPAGIRDLTAQWNFSGFAVGRYAAALKIVDGEGNELTGKTIQFYAFPVWYLLWFMVALGLLYEGIRFFKNKVKISIAVNK